MNKNTMVPDFRRSFSHVSIGLNDAWEQIWDSLRSHTEENQNYPPYNILNKEGSSKYVIEIALAGFKKEEIDIDLENGILKISGKSIPDHEKNDYIYKGIGTRKFSKSWTLSEHVVVHGATYQDGILSVELEQVIPEEKKPKKIEITSK